MDNAFASKENSIVVSFQHVSNPIGLLINLEASHFSGSYVLKNEKENKCMSWVEAQVFIHINIESATGLLSMEPPL